jgi:hypothetical protein
MTNEREGERKPLNPALPFMIIDNERIRTLLKDL